MATRSGLARPGAPAAESDRGANGRDHDHQRRRGDGTLAAESPPLLFPPRFALVDHPRGRSWYGWRMAPIDTDKLAERLERAYPELATIRDAAGDAPVYIVGGAVRDLLLGCNRTDL